jgi:hypothetical protein
VVSGASAPRTAVAWVLTLLALITGLGCESQPATLVSESAPSKAGTDDPPSASPDLQVQTFKVASRDELVRRLGDLAWEETLVFPNGIPKSLEIWGGDGRWHAQTHYVYEGRRIEVTQAGVGGLQPGRRVRIRGEYGVRSQGSLYWIERDFAVAFSPGEKELAAQLEWVPLGK